LRDFLITDPGGEAQLIRALKQAGFDRGRCADVDGRHVWGGRCIRIASVECVPDGPLALGGHGDLDGIRELPRLFQVPVQHTIGRDGYGKEQALEQRLRGLYPVLETFEATLLIRIPEPCVERGDAVA